MSDSHVLCLKVCKYVPFAVNSFYFFSRLRVYVKIFLVMGISWLLEIISHSLSQRVDEAYWYPIDLINCSQGSILFIIYVCKEDTVQVIKSRLGCVTSSPKPHLDEERCRKTTME